MQITNEANVGILYYILILLMYEVFCNVWIDYNLCGLKYIHLLSEHPEHSYWLDKVGIVI